MTTLYVSCPFQGGLFRIDTKTDEVQALSSDHRPGTGLTFLPGGNLAQIVGGNEVWIIDPTGGEVRERITLSSKQPYYHDLKIWDNRIYAVSTQYSRIDVFDYQWERIEIIGPLTNQAQDPMKTKDTCHFNSITFNPLGQIFGCAFGLTEETEGWRKNKKGGVLFYLDRHLPVVLVNNFQQPHSLVLYNEYLWMCESIPGHVVAYNYDWKEVVRMNAGSGFARGLTFDQDYCYVGLSANRHPKIYGYDYDYTLDHAVVVGLSLDGKTKREWVLPCPEIYDIVIG